MFLNRAGNHRGFAIGPAMIAPEPKGARDGITLLIKIGAMVPGWNFLKENPCLNKKFSIWIHEKVSNLCLPCFAGDHGSRMERMRP